ncbi:penicillin-binding transpeptidase domain-containing protein [Lactococcus nasutitermitis]|uniref:Penicillin-binding transpeptidase domain-containing protein n=1 Tax=Lactococcus nasutitermitis TaxID=1652957 RepID=A0ABV9JH23_9LACT|nr:penicillin-binding transpeptidase domain-containing protein [Lactococcus nasutitermitis]
MSESRKSRNNQTTEKDKGLHRTTGSGSKKILKNPVHSIPARINILFFVIFALFVVLIGRLYYMQILHPSYYAQKNAGTASNVKIITGAPRGNIYDATGKPLAVTTPEEAVDFTRGQNATAPEMRAVADKLSTVLSITIDAGTLTKRDKIDYYLADQKNLDKIANSLTKAETTDKDGNELDASATYAIEVKKVTDNDIAFNDQQLFAAKLFKEMNSTSVFNTTTIATGNITAEQQATIAEQEGSLPGISVATSWTRTDSQNSLTNILGNVTSQKQGIPADMLDTYLKKGYQRNDRVGVGFIEQGYDQYLQGTHQISKVEIDKSGNVTGTKVTQKGKQGDDLKLTINLAFQEGVDNIVKSQLDNLIATGHGDYNTGAYAVVLDSKTGAVLALSGFSRDPKTGEISSDTNGTFQSAFTPGSVVKMGTLTAGWDAGAISGNQVQDDQAIVLPGTKYTSWWGSPSPLPITAVQALEYSSNTYMIQVALKMLGEPYIPNMTLSTTNRVKVYDELRKAYASYGLGTSTGFDIPGESTGIVNPTNYSGTTIANLLLESFGQYDNYTPLQLAVYGATIANNGKRISPHIVQGIYDSNSTGGIGQLVKTIQPKTMDTVNITPANLNVLQQGMYEVVHGTDAYTTGGKMGQAANTQISISAKTGTSENEVRLPNGTIADLTANNVVAYAPSENPQIAIGVVIPNNTEPNVDSGTDANQLITTSIVNLYQQMYKFK